MAVATREQPRIFAASQRRQSAIGQILSYALLALGAAIILAAVLTPVVVELTLRK